MPDGRAARGSPCSRAPSASEYERSLLAANRAAEASGPRVQVLQSSAAALIGHDDRARGRDTLVASAAAAFDASSVTVFLVDDDGELVTSAGVERRPTPTGRCGWRSTPARR